MNNDLKFKNHIKDIRTSKNMSQEELAKLVGTSRQTIIAIEKGTFNPTAKLAMLLTYALDTPFEQLFYFED